MEECESICMCVRCDRCDRCGQWSGTARCCCNRGQVPTCHWSVLMLTRGGGCAHLIDRKMAASRICRWCRRHISFLVFSPSLFCALFVSLSPSPSLICSSRNTKQSLILSAIPPIFSYLHSPVLLCTVHIYACLFEYLAFHTVISVGTLHA